MGKFTLDFLPVTGARITGHERLSAALGAVLLLCLAGTSYAGKLVVHEALHTAGTAQATPTKLRLIRSESGTKGSEQGGRYIIEDPRNAFRFPDDGQVIVYFEWQGHKGAHHFEGRWRNPEGKVVVISDFEYEAPGSRFGAYWTLPLNESVKKGLWALEAYVDGTPAGMHAFRILSESDADVIAPARRLLTPSEIYERVVAATVFIDKLDDNGQHFGTGSGFVVSETVLVTAFQTIDGANSLQLLLSDGRRVEVSKVVAWNRKRNWVFLRAPLATVPSLNLAEPGSWSVGDRCFSLDAPMLGSRVIREGHIIGRQDFPEVGERLNADLYLDPKAIGSPVLDEHGDVIGIATRSDILPGLASSERLGFRRPSNLPEGYWQPFVVPVNMIGVPTRTLDTISLAELARKGQFIQPLVPNEHLAGGTIGRGVERRKKRPPELVGEGFEFSRHDPQMVVFVRWSPLDKFKSRSSARIYNLDNRLLFESKPDQLKLKAYEPTSSWWVVNIADLPAATYRVDVVLDQAPVWRSFFRIVE